MSRQMNAYDNLRACLIGSVVTLLLSRPVLAGEPATLTEAIQIQATPKTVFNAIRKYRTSAIHQRKCVSHTRTSAIIDEHVEGVPIYGKVHCLWEEQEHPYGRIDYSLTYSDKFKSGSGSYIITPPTGNGPVTLTLVSRLDCGSRLPFANQMTAANSRKDMRLRLQYIKRLAEEKPASRN